MYTSYYQLSRKPFEISTDPSFLWLGEKHKEALSVLIYGIQYNKGLLLLTGDVGTGKTTLIKALIRRLKKDVIIAGVPDPGLDTLDFFNVLASKFKLKKRFNRKAAFLETFSHFLNRAYDLKKKVLLIIDEAQRMSPELMDEVRVLSNMEKDYNPLINIFFIGQMEFNDILVDPKNRALRQRITINYHIETLDEEETGKYIEHRLKVAGSTGKLFEKEVVQEIYALTGGYPRLINVLCDQSLLNGYIKNLQCPDALTVRESAERLRIGDPGEGSANNPGRIEARANEEEHGKNPPSHRFIKQYSTLVWFLVMILLIIFAGYLFYSAESGLFFNKIP